MNNESRCEFYACAVDPCSHDGPLRHVPYCIHPYSTVTRSLALGQDEGGLLLSCDGRLAACQVRPLFRPWPAYRPASGQDEQEPGLDGSIRGAG